MTSTTMKKDAAKGAPEAGGMPPAMRLYQMLSGGVLTQVLAALAELGVCDELSAGPRTADDLAGAVGADAVALRRLLRAGVAAGLLEEAAQDRFSLTPVGDLMRRDAQPISYRSFAIMTGGTGAWRPMERLADAVRSGSPVTTDVLGAPIYDYYGDHADEREHFDQSMADGGKFESGKVAAALAPTGAKRAVDVAGGRGVLLSALLSAEPGLEGVLFDQPDVIAGAHETLDSAGVADRVTCVSGDMFESVPSGDLLLLKYILSDWDDERAVTILRNCARALEPGGRLWIVGGILDPSRHSLFDTLFDMQMLAIYGGRLRTVDEYQELLEAAGLRIERSTSASDYGPKLLEAAPAGS